MERIITKNDNPLMDAINCSPPDNFIIIPNTILKNPSISFKAKGIFSLLISNEDEYIPYLDIIKKASTDGETSIKAGLSELEKAGYFRRFKYRDKKTKKWVGSFWGITDTPNSFNIDIYIQKLEKLGCEIPTLKKQ